jgi:hypothetical protein
MSWPWRRQGAKPIEPRPMASIGAEVFGARPGEVEEMINSRLEDRWLDEREPVENIGQEKCGEKLWPATFSVGE